MSEAQVDWNPVAVRDALWDLAHRIEKGVLIVDEAYGKFDAADEAYVQAEAREHVRLEQEGVPAAGRRYHVAIAITEERKRRRIAERAYKKATTNMKALIEGLNALRSIGAGVRKEWETVGVEQQ